MLLNKKYSFDADYYRVHSTDLRDLGFSDAQLKEHYLRFGKNENRPFSRTDSVSDLFSMKYLRGSGVEIGGGSDPVLLSEGVECMYADIGTTTLFDSDTHLHNKDIIFDLNDPYHHGSALISTSWDFVIARHVLEHCDSFILAMQFLSSILRSGGYLYIALPLKDKSCDAAWMPYFGKFHHVVERFFPKIWLHKHLRDFKQAVQLGSSNDLVPHQVPNIDLEKHHYLMHRCSYELSDWLDLLVFFNKYFLKDLQLIDVLSCSKRDDVNFIFMKS
jgi:SAM-dependent methyltransferase